MDDRVPILLWIGFYAKFFLDGKTIQNDRLGGSTFWAEYILLPLGKRQFAVFYCIFTRFVFRILSLTLNFCIDAWRSILPKIGGYSY
jgi:hypothetical protein